MHRLFVACRPPPFVRAQLTAMMGGVEGANWQRDEQLHITLRFIGEVDSRTANDVASALEAVHASPLTLRLSGIGTFDQRGRIHTLWAGVEPKGPITQLHHKIDRALARAGLVPDERAYLPHVTLARFGARLGDLSALAAAQAGFATQPFSVDQFSLYESLRTDDGMHYQAVADYPLAGP